MTITDTCPDSKREIAFFMVLSYSGSIVFRWQQDILLFFFLRDPTEPLDIPLRALSQQSTARSFPAAPHNQLKRGLSPERPPLENSENRYSVFEIRSDPLGVLLIDKSVAGASFGMITEKSVPLTVC